MATKEDPNRHGVSRTRSLWQSLWKDLRGVTPFEWFLVATTSMVGIIILMMIFVDR